MSKSQLDLLFDFDLPIDLISKKLLVSPLTSQGVITVLLYWTGLAWEPLLLILIVNVLRVFLFLLFGSSLVNDVFKNI
jgi:hypothetical protein